MLRKSNLQSSRELNDMQKNYESPEMEVIELENHDVIVDSTVDPLPGDDHYNPWA